MRELSTREKVGIVVVIVAAIVALYYFGILDLSKFGLTGGDLGAKKAELKSTEDLIEFDKLVSDIEDDIMKEVGLQGNLISESLFKKISEKLSVEKLNQANTPKDFDEIDSALKNKASAIAAYRKEIGGFEDIEQMKKIKCSIFKGEPAQAVISRRISELAKKVGINPKYQLTMKPLPGKSRERITIQDRQKLVEKLYRHELEEELNRLTDRLESGEAGEQEEVQSTNEDAEEDMETREKSEVNDDSDVQKDKEQEEVQSTNEDVMTESLDSKEAEGDDSSDEQEVGQSTDKPAMTESLDSREAEGDDNLDEQEENQSIDEDAMTESLDSKEAEEEKKIDRKFPSLDKRIPIETRIEIVKAILSSDYSIKRQVKSNVRLKKIIDEFQMPDDAKPLNIKPLMLNYVKQVDKSQQELLDWLKVAPTSYSKQAYFVEMLSVKGKLEQLVKFIHSIESSSKFFKIRDFQITIADKKETVLNANIKIIATVL